MDHALVERFLIEGRDASICYHTRTEADPLTGLGATVVGSPPDLADGGIAFAMVGGQGMCLADRALSQIRRLPRHQHQRPSGQPPGI